MSNVLYQCPICKLRLFAAPGGTALKCVNHTDQVYQQVEDYQGPNFAYKDEGDTDPRKTGVITPGAQTVTPVVKEVRLPEMSEDELKEYYRKQYALVSNGDTPDKRWGIPRLKDEIEAWEKAHTPEPPSDGEGDGDSEGDSDGDGDTGASDEETTNVSEPA